ncbi:copper chaperone PCu(A)C [Oceaniglobus ichthyenteri]|uniref:copper chaperone PCu(A)C n=1 Tax=Oceaniglobus ichthyenteri TaxID=2136177 RepID=UPI000D38419F|nr:copper chaperone PCu(A)C [Oceaniglobus ichthyenteri]
MKPMFSAVLATLCLTAPAYAHDYTLGDLTISHPMAFETTAVAQTAGGFMTVTNAGDTADKLLEVRGDFPRIEIHTTEMTDGVARMMKQEFIALPAGETVTFQPGGYHVMFMGLGGDPFEVGEEIPLTLVFENAGEIDVVFDVEPRPTDTKGMDHSGHKMEK